MSNTTDVPATLRDMWDTRPRRRRGDAKFAGVAGAVARRYAIDPVLVRIGFVVAAFYGVGFALYLAGWLVLPADDHDPPRGAPRPLLVIGLVIAALATTGTVFGRYPGTLVGLAVAAVLLFLLHRQRGALGLDQPANAPAGTAGTAGTAGAPGGESGGPPSWDPLGAAPFAWDLPEPEPPAPPAPRHRSLVTVLTMGVALVVGGVSGGLLLAGGELGGLRTVFGLTLGVIGLGLVIGSFRHRGRGLILPAIPLILLTYGLTAAPLDRFHGIGDQSWSPATPAAIQPVYQLSAGNATLDLRRLALTGTDPVHTRVEIGVGDATVLLPADADVTLHCHAGVGQLNCLGETAVGRAPDRRLVDTGPDGPGGGTIDLDVSVGAGNVEVRRG